MLKLKAFSIALLTLVFVGGTACTFSSADDEKIYRSEKYRVKITFPGTWKATNSELIEGRTTYTVQLKEGNAVYQLNTTIHEDPLGDYDAGQYAYMTYEEFRQSLAGKELQRSTWKYDEDYAGLQATVKMEQQNYLVQYRVLYVEQYLYQLIVMSPADAFDEKAADQFMDSFVLL